MSSVTLDDLLYNFKFSFSSCEVRTFAALQDDKLVNIVTSLIFSYKPIDPKRNDNLVKIENAFSTGKVRFIYNCIHPDNAYTIFQDISVNGIIKRRSFPSVNFSQFDASELRVNPDTKKMKEDFGWNIFTCEHQREQIEQSVWSLLESQRGKAINLNYSGMYDLINDLLEIYNYNSGDKRDFIVQVPIYARIAELTQEKVKVQMHHTISNLFLNLTLQRSEYYQYMKIDKKQMSIEKCKQINEDPFCYFENTFRFQKEIKPHDFIDVSLLNSKIPVLTLDQNRAIVPLENTVEPFAKTLFEFYPLDIFKKHLFEPEKYKNAQDVFQDAIIRLLSLLGLPTAVQGNRKYIIDKERATYEVVKSGSIPIGSADIISYIENEKMLLIDCTIDIPDENKINRLNSLVKHFSFIQNEQGYPRISSLIFTPKDCRHIQNNVGIPVVKIIDKFNIEDLLELALQGKPENVRKIWCIT